MASGNINVETAETLLLGNESLHSSPPSPNNPLVGDLSIQNPNSLNITSMTAQRGTNDLVKTNIHSSETLNNMSNPTSNSLSLSNIGQNSLNITSIYTWEYHFQNRDFFIRLQHTLNLKLKWQLVLLSVFVQKQR